MTFAERRAAQQKKRAAKQKEIPDARLAIRLAAAQNSVAIPPAAPFLGNATLIDSASEGFLLYRETNCSLTMINLSFAANSSGTLTESQGNVLFNYELTLHDDALLKTQPDQFRNGCKDPVLGVPAQQGFFGGLNKQGMLTGAVAVGALATGSNPYTIEGLIFDTSGNLKGYAPYTADGAPTAIAAGDLNGDGNPDFVSRNQSSFSVFLGKADGTLGEAASTSLPGSAKPQELVIEDVNGDGKLDILVSESVSVSPCTTSCQAIALLLYEGKGDGTFGSPTVIAKSTLPAGVQPVGFATGDFNGDGRPDVVFADGAVFLNQGTDTFKAASTAAFIGSAYTLFTGDFNKDGKVDLAIISGIEQTGLQLFLGNGNGTFNAGDAYALPAASGLYVYATDLDGDGNPDLYSGMAGGGVFGGQSFPGVGTAYALMGNGDGSFQGAPEEPFSFNGPQYEALLGPGTTGATSGNLVDLNGDKKVDAVAVTESDGAFAFTTYLGKGDGTFLTGPSLDIGKYEPVSAYTLADFNGDGIVDLAFPNGASDDGMASFLLAQGKGDGSFETPKLIAVPDIFATGVSSDNVSLLEGFTSADFNHDGKADLMYYVSGSGSKDAKPVYVTEAAIQLGKGDGTFEAPILVPLSGGMPTPIQISDGDTTLPDTFPTLIEDVNGDGVPDLLFYEQTGKTVQLPFSSSSANVLQVFVALGKGDGTFKTPVATAAADNVSGQMGEGINGQILLADMNGDGKPDLISTGFNADGLTELAISLGNGDGTFAKPTIYFPMSYQMTDGNLAAGDFNGDGKIDLTFQDGLFLGNGDGTLQVTSATGGMSAPSALLPLVSNDETSFVADFNGDGKLDLLNGSILFLNEYGVKTISPSPSTDVLTISPNPAGIGQKIALTAQIAAGKGATGTPTGTVTFKTASTILGTGTLNASGAATLATATLAAGSYSITAVYSGDSSFAASTSAAVTLNVTAAPAAIATTTALSASASTALTGASITFTASVAAMSGSTPAGSVTFCDGETALGTETLANGSAVYSTASLSAGSHSVTAKYAGSASDAASTSGAVVVTITAPAADFSVSLSPTSGSVAAGASATTTVSITPIDGFKQAVSLACSSAPSGANCSISPGSVTPNGTTPATAILTLQGGETALLSRPGGTSNSGRGAISLGLLGGAGMLSLLALRRRRSWANTLTRLPLVGLLSLFISLALSACGGSSHTPVSTNYAITVTATAGANSHTASYSLTVQ